MEDVEPKVQKMYEKTTKVIEDWSTSLLIEKGMWGHVSLWDARDKKKVMIMLWYDRRHESIKGEMFEYEMKGM